MKAVYKIADTLALSLRNLALHKFRSFLTALGILIGVCSVIAMLAVNEGFSYESQRALRRMGTDKLWIRSAKPSLDASAAARDSGALNYGLTHADGRRLSDNMPGVRRMVAGHETQKSVQYGRRLVDARVFGTSPGYMALRGLALVDERFLTPADEIRSRSVCVLTASMARDLFHYEDPIGKVIRIGGEAFTVVGLVERPERLGGDAPVESGAQRIYIPASADKAQFGEYTIVRTASRQEREMVEISEIIFQMADEQAVLSGSKIAESLLDRWHDNRDYEITVPLALIEQLRKQRRLWNIMFFFIASVSLIVGGIGIMNIMLASTTERTREIGIRRALGAKRGDIVAQFLVEAVTISTIGGLMGVGLGLLVPNLLERVLSGVGTQPLELSGATGPLMLLIPFLMAIAVGLVSGLYPAWRASRLDPIQALRHE